MDHYLLPEDDLLRLLDELEDDCSDRFCRGVVNGLDQDLLRLPPSPFQTGPPTPTSAEPELSTIEDFELDDFFLDPTGQDACQHRPEFRPCPPSPVMSPPHSPPPVLPPLPPLPPGMPPLPPPPVISPLPLPAPPSPPPPQPSVAFLAGFEVHSGPTRVNGGSRTLDCVGRPAVFPSGPSFGFSMLPRHGIKTLFTEYQAYVDENMIIGADGAKLLLPLCYVPLIVFFLQGKRPMPLPCVRTFWKDLIFNWRRGYVVFEKWFYEQTGLWWRRDIGLRVQRRGNMLFVCVPQRREMPPQVATPSGGTREKGPASGREKRRRGDVRRYYVDTWEGLWLFRFRELFEVLDRVKEELDVPLFCRQTGGWEGTVESLITMMDVVASACCRRFPVGSGLRVGAERLRCLQLGLLWESKKVGLAASLEYYKARPWEYGQFELM